MSEHEFGAKVAQVLNRGTAELPASTLDSLRAIREKAVLEAQGRAHTPAYFNWKLTVPVAALAVIYASYLLMDGDDELAQLAPHELEARILTDEMPVHAYLDVGFENWLKTKSQK